jgi:hydroxyproline transport system permease protein
MFTATLSIGDIFFLMMGAGISLLVAVLAMLIGTAGGVVFGLLRSVANPSLRELIAAFLDIFRSIPLLIQLIMANTLSGLFGLNLPAFVISIAVLGLHATAFCSEIVLAAIMAVPVVTRRAARSLGLTYWQDLAYVVFPNALKIALPSWINLSLGILKDTSLLLWIGVIELLRASQIITSRIQQPMLVLSIVGAIYFIMSFPLARLSERLERKWKANDRIA